MSQQELAQPVNLSGGNSLASAGQLARIPAEYNSYVQQIVRGLLSRGMRRRVDSGDVLNDFWLSLLMDETSVPRFRDRKHARVYLHRRAVRQIVKQRRRHVFAACRSIDRETEIDPSRLRELSAGAASSGEAVAPELSRLVAAVEPGLAEVERTVLQLKLNGLSNREIARQLAVDEGTVRRSIRRIALSMARAESDVE